MPTSDYRDSEGKRLPGTTTIINRFKDSGGLIYWAWDQGKQGLDFRQTRDKAADAGTIAHDMIEHFIHDRAFSNDAYPGADQETFALADKGFRAFIDWFEQTRLTVHVTEIPLVSEELRFGGTPDAIGMQQDEYVLLDWKTGNRLYTDHIIQVAAYRHLWELHNPDKLLRSAHILRVGKEYGDFHHHAFPNEVIDLGWDAFKRMRRLYDIDKQLKKAVG